MSTVPRLRGWLTSLSLSTVTRGLDRRVVLLMLTALMLLSGLVVGLVDVGRNRHAAGASGPGAACAGGAQWGNAPASTIVAPLGSFLGQYIGWRGIFLVVVPLAAVTFAWQGLTLPRMPSTRNDIGASALGILKRREARGGMLSVALLFAGQFTLFTYLRLLLEETTRLSVSLRSLVLQVMGGAGLVGTALIGRVIARSLTATLIVALLLMAAMALGLVTFGALALPTALLLALWGLVGTALPVAW